MKQYLLLLILLFGFSFLPAKSVWFDENWQYRIKVTIDANKVNGDLTNFPIYLNLDDFPDALFTGMRSNGYDLRVTFADGLTQVPVEIVWVNTTTKTGELHFQANGTLSGTTNTDFYLYYGNSSAGLPAVNAAYGSDNVWDSYYEAVWHFAKDPSSAAPQLIDSTGHSIDGTTGGLMTNTDLVNCKFGKCYDFDGHNDSVNIAVPSLSTYTISSWIYPHITHVPVGPIYCQNPDPCFSHYNSKLDFDNGSSHSSSASFAINTWAFAVATKTGSSLTFYKNGSADNTVTVSAAIKGDYIARDSGGDNFNGFIDELRISSVVRTPAWLWTEFNNQNTTATFYTVGAVEDYNDYIITAPLLTSLSPVDNGTEISVSDNLILTFDKYIDIQTGNLVIYQANGSIFETINVTSGQVTGNGTTIITINPSSNLIGSTSYFVNIDASAFDDTYGNSYAGITDNGVWSFTTESVGFNSGNWNGSVKFTVRASRIDADLVDFPLYVDLSAFPDAFFSDVESDGADIRVTESDQATETAFELVNINVGTKTGELWFKAAAISSSTDTDFYIWYGNSSAVAYNETDTYGAQNVWTNGYRAVYHLAEDPSAGAGAVKDSTVNEFDATAYNMSSADLVSGKVGNAINFDGSSDYMNTGTVILPTNGSNWNVSFMVMPQQINRGAANVIIEQYSDATTGRTAFQEFAGDYRFYNSGSGAVTVGTAELNKWSHLVFDYNAGTLTTYKDNIAGASSASLANIENTNMNFAVNDTGGDYKFDGIIDEIHISNSSRSLAWIKAVYENQYRPANLIKLDNAIPFNNDNASVLFIYMGD